MSRKQAFQSPQELRKLIAELSQKLGPDHARVRRLKADLSRMIGAKGAAPYPSLTREADSLNKVVDAQRGALEAEKRAAAAATLPQRIEAAKFMAAVLAAVDKQTKKNTR